MGTALSVPATAIGAFGYQLVRPLEYGQSIARAAQVSIALAFSEVIRQAPLAAVCGVLVTFVVVRMPLVVSIPLAGALSATCGGIEWWWRMRASSSFNAQTICQTMAAGWGMTAIVAASIAAAKIKSPNNRHSTIGITQ
jgi:hypothetical protein